jgi:hypothetical protein
MVAVPPPPDYLKITAGTIADGVIVMTLARRNKNQDENMSKIKAEYLV